MKVKFFITIILMIFLLQIFLFQNISIAANGDEKRDIGSVISQGEEWINGGKIQIDNNKLRLSQSFIYNSLLAVGIIITVIWGGFLGIKFMLASAEDKADIKQALIPYAIGCAVIYGAFGIWKIVITVLDKV